MKQVFMKKGKVIIEEVPRPSVKDGYVLVKTISSLISTGSELAGLKHSKINVKDSKVLKKVKDKIVSDGIYSTYKQIKGKFKELTPLGYSCAGVVVECPDVDRVLPGQPRVASCL